MAKPKVKNSLVLKCKKHPRYSAEKKPRRNCLSCTLLFIMRWQHDPQGEAMLGSLNPYAYLLNGDPEEACIGLQVQPADTAQS